MNIRSPSTTQKRRYRMDRRAVAARETSLRIIQATLALYVDRWLEDLTLDDVAARAGVTVQTVLRRFGSKAELIRAAGESLQQQVLSQRGQAPAGDVDGAVANLMEHYEATGDLMLRTLAQEGRHAVLRDFAERGRSVHRAWVEATFAPCCKGLSYANGQRLINRLIVVTDLYTWKLLRRDMALGRDEAQREIVEMAHAVIERT